MAKNDISLLDLSLAYRRVKMFLYRQTGCPKIFKILEFEKDLAGNLARLHKTIVSNDFISIIEQCKGYVLFPHTYPVGSDQITGFANHIRLKNDGLNNHLYVKTKADIPIVCEILFALWIQRCGQYFDQCIGNDVFGDRLVRAFDGSFQTEAPLLYRSFYGDVGKWQRSVLAEAQDYLKKNKRIILFAGQLEDLLSLTILKVNEGQKSLFDMFTFVKGIPEDDLTSVVFNMLDNWRSEVPTQSSQFPDNSIVSGIIKNYFLYGLDKILKANLRPLHYSRCGDRIALIFNCRPQDESDNEDTAARNIFNEVCSEIRKYMIETYDVDSVEMGQTGVIDEFRTRIYHFDSETGTGYLKSFIAAMEEEDQFWKELPVLQDSLGEIDRMFTPFRDVQADRSILTAEGMSLSRRHFAKQIENMEYFLVDLKLGDWREQRLEFLKTVSNMSKDFNTWFSYYSLYPRVLAIAFAASKNVKSKEFLCAIKIIDQFFCQVKEYVSQPLIRRGEECSESHKAWLQKSLITSFSLCVVERLCAVVWNDDIKDELIKGLIAAFPEEFKECEKSSFPRHVDIQNADLANVSFKELLLDCSWTGRRLKQKDISKGMLKRVHMNMVHPEAIKPLKYLWAKFQLGIASSTFPMAFYFSTRPWDITDLYSLWEWRDAIHDATLFINMYKHLGGCTLRHGLPGLDMSDNDQNCGASADSQSAEAVKVWSNSIGDNVKIGLTSWLVVAESWVAMATGSSDPFRLDRYQRWMRIINDVMRIPEDQKPNYLVFPELAIPARLFMRAARKLAMRKISLIAGVDYIRSMVKAKPSGRCTESGTCVRNQVWCALHYDGHGSRPIIAKYTKSRFAQREESELFRAANIMGDKADANYDRPGMVIYHGNNNSNVALSVLICSDLLDIEARARLRGKIDILFVPAWNKDIPTYSSLVESAAYDLHAFVALCNSREYGDTRLRSPAKEEFARDIIRLKGGLSDYYAVGDINVRTLRSFQSAYRSADKPFKPTPTGFDIEKGRRCMPLL